MLTTIDYHLWLLCWDSIQTEAVSCNPLFSLRLEESNCECMGMGLCTCMHVCVCLLHHQVNSFQHFEKHHCCVDDCVYLFIYTLTTRIPPLLSSGCCCCCCGFLGVTSGTFQNTSDKRYDFCIFVCWCVCVFVGFMPCSHWYLQCQTHTHTHIYIQLLGPTFLADTDTNIETPCFIR